MDDAWTTQQREGVLVGREPEHPVVGVSWEDAQAFCKWLMEKETADGKLPKGAKYRLPTDEEWSIAVGLPPEQGATPAEKHEKNGVDFPWGLGYPPKENVGNYADSTYHEVFPDEKDWIEGYTDGFATTAPVGSFDANQFGVYDLGGNVWEWCEDLFEPGSTNHVLRGASWHTVGGSGRTLVLSSARFPGSSEKRGAYNGFRCVLEPAPSPAPVTR